MNTLRTLSPLVLAIALALGAHAATSEKKHNQQVKAAREQLDQAQEKLRKAQRDANDAQRDLQKAQQAQQDASAHLKQALDTATQRAGARLGLPGAVAERDAARQQVNTAREALLTSLKSQKDFQAAVASADIARTELSKLREEKALTEEARAQKTAELSAALRQPAELQKAAEAGDSALQNAMQRFQAADHKVTALNVKVAKQAAEDPAVKAAQEKAKDTNAAFAKAREAANAAQRAAHTAQLAVDREQQQLQRAQSQDRKDDNNPKKKKKN